MGNTQSQVYPELENEAPWIMVTYDPRENYKNFSYHEKFDVYSNNSSKIVDKLSNHTPCPPSNPIEYKVNTNTICSVVQQNIFEDDVTIQELVATLFEKCSNEAGDLQDTDKVKILFYWLTAQNVKYSEYKLTTDFMTVNYQLQKLRDRKNSYAAFFSLLCHYADIPCVIIRGHVKGGRYDVEKPLSSDLLREWNAVLVNEEWQFVDAFWGRIYHGRQMSREEWYLFPSPDCLKYSHFPENKTWQLVDQPLTEVEFISLPILKKRFFEMNMEVLSHTTGKVTCSTGNLEVKFLLNAKDIVTQEFRCVISRQNNKKEWEEEKLPDDRVRLQQLDFIQKTLGLEDDIIQEENHQDDDSEDTSRDNGLYRQESVVNISTALSVKVRFQTKGYHKIEIVGRSNEDEDFDWVAIYHVMVTFVPDRAVYFPFMPNIGYGPNPYLKKCGLEAVSHTNGEIKCFPPTKLKMKFKLLPDAETKKVMLRYSLETCFVSDNDNIDVKRHERKEEGFKSNEGDTILLPIAIELVGEYKLSIAATSNERDMDFVIHYRIVGEVNLIEIKEALISEILKELDMAILSEKMPDLDKAINFAMSHKAHNHQKIKVKYKEACTLIKRLQRYKKVLQRIKEITNNHIAKIQRFHTPDQAIVIVMKAVFILLGENENALQSWEKIRVLITGIGPKNIKRRITGLNVKTLKPDVVQRAQRELGDFNVFHVMNKAEDVAAFAYWIDYIFNRHDKEKGLQAGHSAETHV